MCEADTVQYLRDLIQEKDYLEKIEGHAVIKTLLDQGELMTWWEKRKVKYLDSGTMFT